VKELIELVESGFGPDTCVPHDPDRVKQVAARQDFEIRRTATGGEFLIRDLNEWDDYSLKRSRSRKPRASVSG